MAKFTIFAVFLAALVAVSVAQGEDAQRFRDMQCRREVQESPIDACRQVVDRQQAGGMRFSFPFRGSTGMRMRCCQQLQDVSRECRCAAIRRMVREYEQTIVPREESYPFTETAEQQQEPGFYGETAEQQQYKQQQQCQEQLRDKQQKQYQQQYKQQQGEELYGETAQEQQGEGYYGEAAQQKLGGGRCIQTAEQSQKGQDNYCGAGRRPIIQGGQQAAGEEFGGTTTEQPRGQEYYGSSGRRTIIYGRGQQPAEQEFGETTQQQQQQEEEEGQVYYGSPDRRTTVHGGVEVQSEDYGEKAKQQRGFIGFPPRLGTEQQTTRAGLMKVRQYAARLPAMCRMEPQECSVFSAGQY